VKQLEQRLERLVVFADLQVELAGKHVTITAEKQHMRVEVPDVATGLALCRSALPRGLRRRTLQAAAAGGFSLVLTVRRRSILEVAKGKSGLLSLVGLPHLKLRPLALAFAAIGR
jgi:hypothetical protein